MFLKEKERLLLQDALNKEVMHRIVTLQRWFRVCLIRLHYLQNRDARRIMEVQLLHFSYLLSILYFKSSASLFYIYVILLWGPIQYSREKIDIKRIPTDVDRGFLVFQRNWREFHVFQNRAATVIQTAWRSSKKKSNQPNEQKDAEGTSETRLGRDR